MPIDAVNKAINSWVLIEDLKYLPKSFEAKLNSGSIFNFCLFFIASKCSKRPIEKSIGAKLSHFGGDVFVDNAVVSTFVLKLIRWK